MIPRIIESRLREIFLKIPIITIGSIASCSLIYAGSQHQTRKSISIVPWNELARPDHPWIHE